MRRKYECGANGVRRNKIIKKPIVPPASAPSKPSLKQLITNNRKSLQNNSSFQKNTAWMNTAAASTKPQNTQIAISTDKGDFFLEPLKGRNVSEGYLLSPLNKIRNFNSSIKVESEQYFNTANNSNHVKVMNENGMLMSLNDILSPSKFNDKKFSNNPPNILRRKKRRNSMDMENEVVSDFFFFYV